MNKNTTYSISNVKQHSFIGDVMMLVKIRLTSMVVFTSAIAFVLASEFSFSWGFLALLVLGGFLVTGAANALNQVLEKDFDIKMTRTADRPVAAGRMTPSTAVMIAGLFSLVGVTVLSLFNPLTGLLGMTSLILYAFVYTPLKRHSSVAVLVGAIPGAMPMLIGCVAFDGYISTLALVLFGIQFLWQFPHFWAIASLSFDDYHNAGYRFIPSEGDGVSQGVKHQAVLMSIALIILSFALLSILEMSMASVVALVIAAVVFTFYAVRFMQETNRKTALALMFSSIIYLPVVLIIFIINGILGA